MSGWIGSNARASCPAQKRDEAEASLRASREGAEAAKAQYDLATAGARSEDRAAALPTSAAPRGRSPRRRAM